MEPTPTRRAVRKVDLPPIASQAGETPCPVCGRPMVVGSGAGRPRLTCSPACRDVSHVEAMIEAVVATAHPLALLRLRGALWRVLNGRAWNRGVRAGGER